MKKWMAGVLGICMMLQVSACGRRADASSETGAGTDAPEQTAAIAEVMEENPAEETTNEVMTENRQNSHENILIAYFSWADNTVVGDEEAAVRSALSHYDSIGDRDNYNDADAVTSASVIAPGNTAKMAEWIRGYVGGDVFPIVVTEPYPDNYEECMDRAADEKAENARPVLTEHLDNMDDYDVVFLGFPNWWSTAPMAVFSFLEEYDFSGKTVIPFCSHGTGGVAASVRDITANLPENVTVLEPIGIYRADINNSQSQIEEWLAKLGFEKKEAVEEMESSDRKLKLTIGDQVASITLYDTPAANALYDMLPLELTFEDFNGIEKISYLTEKLPTEGEPDGCDPNVGDFCLYAPWGNLSVFYQDFRYSDHLILLGHVDSGVELFSSQNSDFSAILEVE